MVGGVAFVEATNRLFKNKEAGRLQITIWAILAMASALFFLNMAGAIW